MPMFGYQNLLRSLGLADDRPSVDSLYGRDPNMDLPMGGGTRPGAVYPVGPTRAPVQQTGGGFFDQLLDDRGNPEGLGMLGVGLMGQNSQLGSAIQQGLKMRAFNDQRQALAQYLVRTGIAQDENEGFALASNPDLLTMMHKDNSVREGFNQRKAIADELGLQGEQRNRYLAAGTWDDQTANGDTNKLTPQQREALADRYGLTGPRRQRFILTGQMDSGASRGLNSTELKIKSGDEDAITALDNVDASLAQAQQLLESGQVNTGFGSDTFARAKMGMAGALGEDYLPGEYGRSQATKQYNDLMSEQAIAAMSQTLKGATTDKEMLHFLDILADPTSDETTRKNVLARLRTRIDRERKQRAARIQTLSDAENGTGLEEQAPDATGLSGNGWTVTVKGR